MRPRFSLAALLLLAVSSCNGAPTSPPRTPASTHATALPPELASDARLEYVERITGGAAPEDTLPMVVAIHGMGDTPEHAFETMWAGLPMRARVILPRAPIRWGDGFSWFPFRAGDRGGDALAPAMARAADRIDALVAELAATRPTTGKPVVAGFSQGGMLSYALAVRHGERYAQAVPVAGFLPPTLRPTRCNAVPPISALHGDADDVVLLTWDSESAEALRYAGCQVDLQVVPHLRHEVTPALLPRVLATVSAATGAPPPPSPPRTPQEQEIDRLLEQPVSFFVIPQLGAPGVPPRDVTVRIPRSRRGAKLPVLFVYDGELAFTQMGVDWEVDALAAEGVTRPWIIVAVPSLDRRHELADDTERTAAFLADVVLPAVAERAPVDLRRSSIAVVGFSFGGLAAAKTALTRPDVFGRMIAMSPSLWWHGQLATRGFERRRNRLPLRAWVDVGTNEQRNPDARPYMTDDARGLRDALLQRGMRFGENLGYREDVGSPHGFGYAGHRMRWALAFALSDVDLSHRAPDDVALVPFGPRHEGRVSVEARYGDHFRLTWPEHDANVRRDGDWLLAEIEGVSGRAM